MKKNGFIMGIAIVALLAFGGSFAYFSATTGDTTSAITTGYVKLTDNGALAQITTGLQNKMPGDELLAANAIQLTVDTTEAAGNYVAIQFTISAANNGALDIAALGLNAETALGNSWKQIYSHTGETTTYDVDSTNDGTATGIYVYVGANAVATPTSGTVNVNTNAITLNATDVWAESTPTASNSRLMGATITITLAGKSIQSSHITAANSYKELYLLFNPAP